MELYRTDNVFWVLQTWILYIEIIHMYFICALKNLPQILMDYGFLILPICFFQLSRFKVTLHYIYVIGISFSDLFYLYFIF